MKHEPFKDLKQIARESDLLKPYEIMNAVTYYNDGEFNKMYGIIIEYQGGPAKFFTDMYLLFESQKWRSAINKYLNFVGMTIEFCKEESIINEFMGSHFKEFKP